jgi:putative transposase
MVKGPEDFEYSGHRAYLGLDRSGLVDTEPVLRHFGATKKRAVEVYTLFVEASLGEKSQGSYYRAAEGRLLGSGEFVDEIRHRVGEDRALPQAVNRTSIEDLLSAAERSSGLTRQEVCSKSKNRRTVSVKEAVIALGREKGIDPSAVTRRTEAARSRNRESLEQRQGQAVVCDLVAVEAMRP